MQVIPSAKFTTTRWKNGGGITHEIAVRRCANNFIWRLSVAEVSSNGPFSVFPAMERILTVIHGDGIHLHHEEGTILARPYQPVRFSGELPIESVLVSSVVQDFNLIYDPTKVSATVKKVDAADVGSLVPSTNREFALYCASGEAETANGELLPDGSCTLFEQNVSIAGTHSTTELLLVTLDYIT